MAKALENLETDPIEWTREAFAERMKTVEDFDENEYGDPVDALYHNHDSSYRNSDMAVAYEGSWITVASVRTESSDTFLYSHEGRLTRVDLAAELYLSDPDYFGSPNEFYFEEVKYLTLGLRADHRSSSGRAL